VSNESNVISKIFFLSTSFELLASDEQMGMCCSTPTADDPQPVVPTRREVPASGQPSLVMTPAVGPSESPSGQMVSGRGSLQAEDVPMNELPTRKRLKSTTQKVPSTNRGEVLPPASTPAPRIRAKSSVASSSRHPSSPTGPGGHDLGWPSYPTNNHKSTHPPDD
jgi:hypothetical protein